MSKISFLLKPWNVSPASKIVNKIINYGINNYMNTNLVNIFKNILIFNICLNLKKSIVK